MVVMISEGFEMAISAGYTDDEIRDLVFEYVGLAHGQKELWMQERGFSRERMSRWRKAIFDGDLDRGLIPREGSSMTSPSQWRKISHHREQREAENEALRARVRELEATNEALGKAIGLLHQINEREPDTPKTTKPNSSSKPKMS